jgi:hypothetical protein
MWYRSCLRLMISQAICWHILWSIQYKTCVRKKTKQTIYRFNEFLYDNVFNTFFFFFFVSSPLFSHRLNSMILECVLVCWKWNWSYSLGGKKDEFFFFWIIWLSTWICQSTKRSSFNLILSKYLFRHIRNFYAFILMG